MQRITRAFPLIVLILMGIFFLYNLVFTDLILGRGDTYDYFYPYWDIRNSTLQTGQLPLWNPDIFMGVPLLANPQLGTFYSLNWLTIPFSAPDAIRISIVLHIILASIGTYLFFYLTISRSVIAGLSTALIFALSGYLSAHIEQINQLQGMAWLPWLMLCLHYLITKNHYGRYLILLGVIWALQILSGHTQTVFISGIALGMYALFYPLSVEQDYKYYARRLGLLASAVVIAISLASPQLLPTLELTGMSNRGGGFDANQATAFSLPPNYITRALLPSYDGQLFTEYIAYIGVIALGLASFAVISPRRSEQKRFVWVAFVIIGLIFALGRYTPIYSSIAGIAGFNLFRVPARWLVLYVFGMAMLAGQGIISLQNSQAIKRWHIAIILVGLSIMMALARILPILQSDVVGSAQPTLITLGIWSISLLILFIIFRFAKQAMTPSIALIAIGVELFLASLIMPHNDLIPRDTYLGQRFTISQMLALTDDETPPARVLPISLRLFDTGDRGTLQARYDRFGLDTTSQQIAFTAVKSQEILFRNLGMTWHIPTIDGYGGGVLPTIYYSQFTSLMLPDGEARTTDGRIGELMASADCRGACLPALEWLQLTHTDYIITDKNFDVPHNGIFFDTSLAEYWSLIPDEPNFDFDTVQVLLITPVTDLDSVSFDFLGSTYYLASTDWVGFTSLLTSNSEDVLGASAVNTRTNTFLQLTPANFSRILSSDIKIYQITPSARAQLATNIVSTADDWDGHEQALTILQDNPETLVVHDAPLLEGTSSGDVIITEYSDTSLTINVRSDAETYLYLADAYYPGWQATVNGIETPIYRANVMFRAVPVPAGDSVIIFNFVPRLWYSAMIFGGIAWTLIGLLLIGLFLRKG